MGEGSAGLRAGLWGEAESRCRARGGSHQLSLRNLFFVRGNGMDGWTDFEVESIQEEGGHV